MNKVQWIIDEVLLERHDDVGFPSLAEAAKEAGHDVYQTKYIPFTTKLDYETIYVIENAESNEIPVITYGCIGFLKLFKREKLKCCPGAYYDIDKLKYSSYAPVFGDYMLNDDAIWLPYGEVVRRVKNGNLDKMTFIRPDGVTKAFAGRVIDFEDISETPEALSQYDPISNDEMCVIAKTKEIQGEYRHVIVDHELIAQSQYRWDGKLDIRTDVHPECQRLAKEVSRHEWQPDYVYVVDTAIEKSGRVGIVEFNTFSCSGLYACDTRRIVKEVSHMAHREYKGDL